MRFGGTSCVKLDTAAGRIQRDDPLSAATIDVSQNSSSRETRREPTVQTQPVGGKAGVSLFLPYTDHEDYFAKCLSKNFAISSIASSASGDG